MRADECLAAGDMEGEAVWLRIVKAVETVSSKGHLRAGAVWAVGRSLFRHVRRFEGFRRSESFRLSRMRRLSSPERFSGPSKSLVNCRLSRPDRLSEPVRRSPTLPLNLPPLSSATRNSSSGASAI